MKPTAEQIRHELPRLEELKLVFGSFVITEYSSPVSGEFISRSDPAWGELVTGMEWIRK